MCIRDRCKYRTSRHVLKRVERVRKCHVCCTKLPDRACLCFPIALPCLYAWSVPRVVVDARTVIREIVTKRAAPAFVHTTANHTTFNSKIQNNFFFLVKKFVWTTTSMFLFTWKNNIKLFSIGPNDDFIWLTEPWKTSSLMYEECSVGVMWRIQIMYQGKICEILSWYSICFLVLGVYWVDWKTICV